jgi:adenylosuccinate synthase
MHRVGGGAFPTELGGRVSEDYCAKNNEDGSPTHAIKEELREYGIPFEEKGGKIRYDTHHPAIVRLMNSSDPMTQGIGLRLASKNYGATTGRPRRMGWLDLEAVKYAVEVNGPDLVLTKPNCIRGADSFKLGIGYESGKGFSRGEKDLRSAKPVYQEFQGSDEDITGMTSVDELPSGLREGMDVLERVTGGKIRMISAGAERNQNIVI